MTRDYGYTALTRLEMIHDIAARDLSYAQIGRKFNRKENASALKWRARRPPSGGESDQLVADGLVLSMPPSSARKS